MWLNMQAEIDAFHLWAQANNITISKIKNLVVIPIRSFMRTNIKIDTDVLYRFMAETKILPVENNVRAKVDDVYRQQEHYWNEFFDFKKINCILKRRKQFNYTILTDGVSVSVLYLVPK